MEEKLKKGKSGITLIALVITVIILLILAAVTIGALSGDNGILKNAGEAKQETEKAQIIEQAKIDILGKQTDNTSAELEKSEIKEVLDIYFKEVPEDFTSDTVLTTKEEYGNYEIAVSEIYGGEIKEPTLTVGDMTEEQKKELIGKYVTNYEPASNDAIVTEEGIPGKWMIFNIDDENIYLIASDYITEVPAGKSGTNKPSIGSGSSYPRGVSFSNILNDYAGGSADVTEIGKELNYDYFLNPEKAYTSTNNNMKAVAYMLDTNAWRGFREEGVAEYAIGGPTIELLFEAYNKAYPDTNYPNGKYKARAESKEGYKISTDGGEEGGNTWSNFITSSADYLNDSDPTFVINSTDNAYGMWIASPSANYTSHVVYVDYGGYVGSDDCGYADYGFRPLVCLESRIELKKTGENIYEIIK